MKHKWLEMIQVTGWLHTDNLFLLGLTNTKTGAKTAPCVISTGWRNNLVPGLHSYRDGGQRGLSYIVH